MSSSSILILVACLAAGALVEAEPLSKPARLETSRERALRILNDSVLIDGHNDLPWQMYKNEQNVLANINLYTDMRLRWPISHTDIPRLRTGKVGGQFWALYVQCATNYKDAVRASLDQIDVIKRFVKQYNDTFTFVTTAQGIRDAYAQGKIASLVGMEGGHSIDSSLATLRMFYELGVRYMTVTHNCDTPWAENNQKDQNPSRPSYGLTAFGETVIHEMNRLGMLVDISHVAAHTMRDVLNITRAPVIFSHSNVYSLCNSTRNVPDDVILATKTNGGIIMVSFYSGFVNCGPNAIPGNGTLAQVADHLEYIANLQGSYDHIGVGADYDGVEVLVNGLEDVSKYPALFEELVNRGWTDENLKKLAGENLIRVLTRTEEVSAAIKAAGLTPIETIIPPEDLVAANSTSCRTSWPN